ncbi:hypothetical protein [Sphingomonas oryzagri]|uniref:Uncharacterized protein n=1 Tax=Sphingomonas oryzagri TaxID=3042314 RepID=A0ABT6N1B0_9SPHN|nr:hypothetical protein [Sphingomonas oryzagri]MDH7638136.1 hypothetical protein [Sphingomonas oryzagri]
MYTLDKARGTIKLGTDLEASDDGEAIELGKAAHSEGGAFELWCAQRLVFSNLERGGPPQV